MRVKRSLTLDRAVFIATEALRIARENNMNPLAVMVLDSGGHPVVFNSEDGCGVMRFNVALGKAYGALGMGTSSRDLRDRMEKRPNFASALAAASGGQFVPGPGGVLIVDEDGTAVGSVGLSGDTSEKDEYCAIKAIKAAGFCTEPKEVDANWSA